MPSQAFRPRQVRVGPAPYGLGVFALRPFVVHDYIGPIEGTVIEDPQYESEYCMELGAEAALEPTFPFRYINHSCQPNCELVELANDDRRSPHGELWLEVVAPIAAGDQLTIDYAWPAWAAIPCGCGQLECRGWIVSKADCSKLAPNSPQQRALKRTPHRYRRHLRRLYRLWAKWNDKFFAGKLAIPQIVLTQPSRARAIGSCGATTDPGCRSQIRLQRSLLGKLPPADGTPSAAATPNYRLVAEVLLHEMVHQWGREVATQGEPGWRRHGTAFCAKCNEIGRQLRLLPVRTACEAGNKSTLASCARWPHNARRVMS